MKSSWAITCVNVELQSNVSETVSIIRVDVASSLAMGFDHRQVFWTEHGFLETGPVIEIISFERTQLCVFLPTFSSADGNAPSFRNVFCLEY
jgi:hypothetical protein